MNQDDYETVGPTDLARFIYVMESGYYVTDLFYCIFTFSEVGELLESFFHHFMTLGLFGYSYKMKFVNILIF